MTAGTEWQDFTAGTPGAADTLLFLNKSVTPPAPGTPQQVTAEAFARALAAISASVCLLSPSGGDDTAAIQAALLSFGTLSGWSAGQGGIVYLNSGVYTISATLIVPAGVTLQGSGWSVMIKLATDSQCDMIQFATYQSASQAAILGVSASDIANGFWSSVRHLVLHGDAFHATKAAYCHGINVTSSPELTAAPGDPNFDLFPTIENVWIQACTGDGFYHSGRSGAYLKRVWAYACNGNGFTPSFDTSMDDCLAQGCSTGFYMDHQSNVASVCKSYNNADYTWVSGTDYTVGSVAVYAGAMYFCIADVSGSTVPSSDGTHWTELTNATSPQATGYGYYWDTNTGEHSFAACDGQQNSKGDFYFRGPNAGGITLSGTSAYVNFNNGQADFNSGNPNHYAAVTFDGVSGVNATISSSKQSSGSGVICTMLNSPGANDLTVTTDDTESAVFYGGIPTYARVNGLSHLGGGTDTSGTATVTSPTFTSGTAMQLSTTQDVTLYIAIQTSAALAVAIGPTSSVTTSLMPSKSYALGLATIKVPAGWYVKITGTIADLAVTQVTC